MTTFDRIQALLTEQGISYQTLHHEATRTSEESARVRGESIDIGAKAIVMKVNKTFRLFVLSASLRIDTRKVRAFLKAKKTRFATADELVDLTGLVPGAVPPFGSPILDLELYVDPSILAQPRIAFNAGSLTDSILMTSEDYQRIADPTVFPFSSPG